MKIYKIDPLNKKRPLMLVRGTRIPEVFPDWIAEHMAHNLYANSRGLFVGINNLEDFGSSGLALGSKMGSGDDATALAIFPENNGSEWISWIDKDGQRCDLRCSKQLKLAQYEGGTDLCYTGPYKDLKNFVRDVIPYTGQPLARSSCRQWYSYTTSDGVSLTFRGCIQTQESQDSPESAIALAIDKIEFGSALSIAEDLQITLTCDQAVSLGRPSCIQFDKPYLSIAGIGWLQIVATDEFKSHLTRFNESDGNADASATWNPNYDGFTYNICLTGIYSDPNDFRLPGNNASCRIKVKEGSALCNSTVGNPDGYAIEFFGRDMSFDILEDYYKDKSVELNGDPVTVDEVAENERVMVIRLAGVQSNEELHLDFSEHVHADSPIYFMAMNARKIGENELTANNVISIPEGSDVFAFFQYTSDLAGGTITISRTGEQLEAGFYNADNTLVKAMTKEEVEKDYNMSDRLSSVNAEVRNATKFVWPAGVTRVGNYALNGCTGLTAVTIPRGVTAIGDYAFSDCSALASVTIPEGVTTFGSSVFQNDKMLTTVALPSTIEEMKPYTFSGCSGLTSVTIPEGVKAIGNYGFQNCTKLTSIVIPSTAAKVSPGAFSGCTSLASVTIPEGPTEIGGFTFQNCTSLTSVDIPNGVTLIDSGAFQSCTALTSVTIPEGVTAIKDFAFADCTKLASIDIPSTVTAMGNGAFRNCKKITSAVIPEGVTAINNYLFMTCSALTSITIPNTVKSIGQFAFHSCKALAPVTIPNSVTTISADAFKDVPKIIYSGSATGSPWGALEVAAS